MTHHDKYLAIKNPSSGLVLDATDYEVKLQHFNGSPAQLWKLEIGGPGTFIIANKKNGKVLDIEGKAKPGNKLITFGKHGGENQQWHIDSDGSIVCPAGNLAVDIFQENYSVGNKMVAWSKHGGENQKFHLQFQ